MKNKVLLSVITALTAAFCATVAFSDGPGNIRNTKHNLSQTGGRTIRAVGVDRVCVFCHTPHRALTAGPLWNHTLSSVGSYTMFSSTTLLSSPGSPVDVPDGDSKLCLSCHDGDRPLGAVMNLGGQPTTISMTVVGTGPLTGTTVFGSDLSGHHPISIEISNCLKDCKEQHAIKGCGGAPSYKIKMAAISPEFLKPTANHFNNTTDCNAICSGSFDNTDVGVQCSSCHDAHTDSNVMFLRLNTTTTPWYNEDYSDDLCLACHEACP